uniref:Ribonuclease P/MRP subunit p25 like n=1 Tax=Monodelphis domestica TaxID=13616 RepID=F7E9W3_MONDO
MENYQKASSVEKPLAPPVPGLPPDTLEMRVRDGSKIRNLLGFALGRLESESTRRIVFTGAGRATGKAVTCAEILKRRLPGLHQLTKLHFQQTEDAWVPVVPEAGLDPLTVRRHVPAVWKGARSIFRNRHVGDCSEAFCVCLIKGILHPFSFFSSLKSITTGFINCSKLLNPLDWE